MWGCVKETRIVNLLNKIGVLILSNGLGVLMKLYCCWNDGSIKTVNGSGVKALVNGDRVKGLVNDLVW